MLSISLQVELLPAGPGKSPLFSFLLGEEEVMKEREREEELQFIILSAPD